MVAASAICLAGSFLYMAYVLVRKNIPLASNYGVYFLFSVLYSVFPLLTYLGIQPRYWFVHWSLHESKLLISTQVALVAVCGMVFAYVFHTKYRSGSAHVQRKSSVTRDGFRYPLFATYIVACAVLLYFGHKYSYTSGRGELVHSLVSNAKVILASMYIVYLVRYGVDRYLAVMFIGFAALLLVEQSRWYFISILVATAMYLQATGRINNRRLLLAALPIVVLLSYVGIYRCRVPFEHATLLLSPFYIEADYGSYVILQTYDLIYGGHVCFYTFFSDYVVDPIIYLIPRIMFMGFGLCKDTIGVLPTFISAHEGYLHESYAPQGGFHYIAQASSAVPFVGPLIITYAFAWFTVAVENRKFKTSLHNLSYYLYSAAFMFVFIKTRFDLTVKYYLTLAVPAFLLFGLIAGLVSRMKASK